MGTIPQLLPFGRTRGPGISTVAPDHVIRLLTSKNWMSQIGMLAIETVKTQLTAHETRQEVARAMAGAVIGRVPSLFDLAALKVAQSIRDIDGSEDLKDVQELLDLRPGVLSRAFFRLVSISYLVICMIRQSQAGEGDPDEWVLRNEKWLRDTSVPAVRNSEPPSKYLRDEEGRRIIRNSTKVDWTRGLIRLSSHANIVFPDSVLTDTARIITRPSSLSGFKVLDGKRLPVVRIQPSVEKFNKTFDEMTDCLLKGLNWDNVFIAGGIALGALVCTKDEQATNTPEQWKNSDVDLYIYGLGPTEANEKVEHIFDIFKANAPTGTPVLVVRNSKTITFFSKYPLRRIQVVLKLVRSPKDVLLNFDLDICSVGWDGKEVWMLPRAARAIETGYTVFTMDLINGHYLGDRRATQEQRVFKYSDKGYGIRILPLYLEKLHALKNHIDRRNSNFLPNEWDLDVEKVARDAREWTAKAIKSLTKHNAISDPPQPSGKSKLSHAMLQEIYQSTEDPQRRSCMSSLGIFMRHVAFVEHELAGSIEIQKNDWAAQTYDKMYEAQLSVNYNDAPDYSWDNHFTTEGFINQIENFNKAEVERLYRNLEFVFDGTLAPFRLAHVNDLAFQCVEMEKTLLADGSAGSMQRMTYAASAHDILKPGCDIILPVWLPVEFVEFANKLVPEKAQESGVRGYITQLLVDPLKADVEYHDTYGEEATLFLWRITNVTMWQQLNRTIDEVHEVLWSFHYANAELEYIEEETRLGHLLAQFSRRAIRKTAQYEVVNFAQWVGREPVAHTYIM